MTGIIAWLRSWFDDIYAPKGSGGNIDFDDIYPVGSIYLSLSTTFNPNNVFDGTWERISNSFLYASENGQGVGSTGGSADAVVVEHNHTQNSHNHTQNAHNHATGDSTYTKFLATNKNIAVNGTHRAFPATGSSAYLVYASDNGTSIGEVTGTANKTATNNSQTATNNPTGESGTGKNMPPFLTVNMWKRTA